jgi:hypothetical protein
MPDQPDIAGRAAKEFIEQELAVERAKKASLEARGLAVITTSGVLVTLLFAVAAVVTKSPSFTLSQLSRWLLASSALGFVCAATLGILCNAPNRYLQVDPKSLAILLTEDVWGAPGADAQRELTAARLAELSAAQSRNQLKAWAVVFAMCLQVLAVLLTTLAVIDILVRT